MVYGPVSTGKEQDIYRYLTAKSGHSIRWDQYYLNVRFWVESGRRKLPDFYTNHRY